ncbi:sensor histidine kinase [Mesorhizobium sp. M7A.F.Ca.US.007.01.2.1]|uniref:sensor histidine kinase n=1 Tax=unclassified Mesorhizobium TaxID=325217 RepID=UPI001FE02B90|nr:sensor histidine kinase [Mesorhizobium sp. M7A.F.Ca.US.007.01.2.1]
MSVGESSATILALIIHELATNSLKYGALSAEAGTLDVSCSAQDDAVTIVWTESGGPLVETPADPPGYGSRLVERSVTGHLRGSIAYDWAKQGLIVTLKIQPQRLTQ